MHIVLLLACADTPRGGEPAEGDTEAAPAAGVETIAGVRDDGALPADPEAEPSAGPPEGDPAALFGNVVSDFFLTIGAAAADALEEDPDAYVPATFSYGGYTWDCGLHLKGTTSFRSLDGKAAFKIDFEELDPADPELFGLRRLTLNNMVQDETMLREHAAYRLVADLGLPAPRHGYARVWVNGEPYGVYGVLESMDQDLLDRLWPSDADGNLYESVNGTGDVASDRVDAFELKEEGLTPAYEDLDDLADAFEADPGAIAALLDERFDGAAASWGIELASGQFDGYVFSTNNYLLYGAPVAGRWSFVPWGQDQAFTRDLDVRDTTLLKGRLVRACSGDAACAARVEDGVRAAVDAMEDEAFVAYLEEAAALIAEACDADPRREDPCRQQELLDYVAARPAAVRAQLAR